ncbi:MAG: hypothetical protein JWL64_2470, partial [Frankiales bacterium]|nr:hypothetical protein [Frankiales bacterium]
MTPVRQALLGATVAASVGRLRLPGPPPRWLRTNHRGEPVSLV